VRTLTYGDTGSNEGIITVFGADGTSKILSMEIGNNESHTSSYTVPAGYTAYISEIALTEASLKGSHISLWMRPFGLPWYNRREFSLLDSPIVLHIGAPLPVAEKTDIEFRCAGIAAGAVVSGGFLGWIEEN